MTADSGLDAISHVVVLMLENRSFDQMLGYLYTDGGNVSPAGQEFDGLTGDEFNLDQSGNPFAVFKITADLQNAYYMPLAKPEEGFLDTNAQLFGSQTPPDPPVATNTGFLASFEDALTPQPNVTVASPPLSGAKPANIMGAFAPETLPVLSTLAKGYAVCDRWFASVPTQTMPNRAFALAATSVGRLTDQLKSYPCPSIFGSLTAHQVDWKVYGYDAAPLTQLDFPDTKAAPEANYGQFKDFVADAAAGTLPSFSFVEPDFGATGNDQHPVYNVAAGEQLIHDVYRACRDGQGWDQTVLIVTYDEHGGCYDHVSPPLGATPPDTTPGELQGFDFTRFGVRVPTVLISPLIPAGTVFRAPAGGPPLDHTSTLATIEQRWAVPPLTARDAAAPTFAAVFSELQPRTDDPLAGVTPPAVEAPSGAQVASTAPTHIQQVHAALAADLPTSDDASSTGEINGLPMTSDELKSFIDLRIAAWHQAKSVARLAGRLRI